MIQLNPLEQPLLNKSIRSHGVTFLLSGHPAVRRLKRLHRISIHGNKLWSSSWVLMDFLGRQKIPSGLRIMDVGCGWGLLGIFCAKKLGALVTSVDNDPEVLDWRIRRPSKMEGRILKIGSIS
jgi:2-polyprenyl-3-methyl-5-hydroxy-6-metoxy-1,4-benzoquinol methylase